MGKIIDIMQGRMKEGKPFFSFEFFPPKTDDGVENLFERMDRMVSFGPTFCDITWGAGGSTADLTLDIAERMQNEINVECMMHLTCTNMPESKLKEALAALQKSGVKNILALRGDPPHGQDKFEAVDGGFACALDLIRYIRKETGDHFGIGVSGYPEAHPDAIVDDKEQMEKNYWADIHYLKEKLDAGADFVVTQLFYDVDIFTKWVTDCRSVGITAPIIPGIMPIMAYAGFNRMTSFCKTYVPQAIRDKIESLRDDSAGLMEYGIQLGVDMCKKILSSGASPGLHMYSLNQDKSVIEILRRLDMIDVDAPPRVLPFRPRTRAPHEAVRPVYWQNRPQSYVQRTTAWTAVPRLSWSERSGEAFREPTEAQMMRHVCTEKRKDKAREIWGEPATLASLQAMFSQYYKEGGPFPWAEGRMHHSVLALTPALLAAIDAGYLPINALPSVNGASSNDPNVGWGPAGGYVYQKGYVEFFCSPDQIKKFLRTVQSFDTMSYAAVSAAGDLHTDLSTGGTLSWGAFPASPILQPLVTDPSTFKVWAKEAFALWGMWSAVCDTKGQALLQEIQSSWFLVSVTENDYVSGNVFRALS